MKKIFASILLALALSVSAFAVTNTYPGFTADTPLALVDGGLTNGVNSSGRPYTQENYAVDETNGTTFLVSVATYQTILPESDLQLGLNGFAKGANGTISQQRSRPVSGQPGLAALITLPADANGIVVNFWFVISFRGNRCVMFVYGFYGDAATANMTEARAFYNTITI